MVTFSMPEKSKYVSPVIWTIPQISINTSARCRFPSGLVQAVTSRSSGNPITQIVSRTVSPIVSSCISRNNNGCIYACSCYIIHRQEVGVVWASMTRYKEKLGLWLSDDRSILGELMNCMSLYFKLHNNCHCSSGSQAVAAKAHETLPWRRHVVPWFPWFAQVCNIIAPLSWMTCTQRLRANFWVLTSNPELFSFIYVAQHIVSSPACIINPICFVPK